MNDRNWSEWVVNEVMMDDTKDPLCRKMMILVGSETSDSRLLFLVTDKLEFSYRRENWFKGSEEERLYEHAEELKFKIRCQCTELGRDANDVDMEPVNEMLRCMIKLLTKRETWPATV